MYKEIFHNRIKEKRKSLGFTQAFVSKETGINRSDLSKYENGEQEPTIEKLGILSNYYNTPIDWFFGRE